MSPISQEEFFSNTPYSAPALQLVKASALDLQIKRAYKWFTNHPSDLTGFVMSMDSSGTSVLVTFRSAGKQKWQFSQFLPSKSQSLQSMTARFWSCQEVLPSLTCKFIWGRIHDTVLQERFFFFWFTLWLWGRWGSKQQVTSFQQNCRALQEPWNRIFLMLDFRLYLAAWISHVFVQALLLHLRALQGLPSSNSITKTCTHMR